MTVVMTIMMIIVTRRYTDPILELATISTRMSNLDFDAKYTGKHKDEIGVLGNSMNELSAKLEGQSLNLKGKYRIAKRYRAKDWNWWDEKRFYFKCISWIKNTDCSYSGYAEGLKDNINDDPESMEFYCDVIIDESDKMNKMVKNCWHLHRLNLEINR